ncbi:putative pseudouridylate synthase [Halobacteriovorax marinus SJ]|uniref:Pseudouridylate synthase n=1 Tax=Halobacteriovorax marinus (strain ATCC BAA-682 / DSM 15412 / SJ) TaxID=862908 RepID=E1WXS2_HALMS|nr:RNA pseudouridine synthase [Halobacteriovorax marinus]CBW25879.1 putative pseudouridylate synthase [Halobacteriovorax marinus SJ]
MTYLSMVEIIAEDQSWILINKPGAMSVHNDSKSVIEYFKQRNINLTPPHRIDKETSGLLLLTKEKNEVSNHQQQLKNASKYYIAICRGQVKADNGKWEQPLSDKAEGHKNPAGKKSDQKICLTNWWKVSSNQYVTLILFKIETGRTHQIRKHCALNGHEILGDKRYGQGKYQKIIKDKYQLDSMLLHSYRLEILLREEPEVFYAKMPQYFKDIMGEEIEKSLQDFQINDN